MLPSILAGAALAFVNLYDVLKGDFNVLKEFWVEILIAFVKNLFSSAERDCNNEVTRKALGFIGRILRENSEILIAVREEFTVRVCFQNCSRLSYFCLKENDRRRIPQSLTSTKIPELVVAIFQYSASRNKHCRYACMNLISDLSQAAGSDCI